MLAFLRCLWRRHHTPVRHYLGGFRCGVCGLAGADLEAMGFADGGYVRPLRIIYGRGRDEGVTRSDW